jgi:hypothetical protein
MYRYLLRHRLLPTSGAMLVADILESHARRWRKERLDAEVSAVTGLTGTSGAHYSRGAPETMHSCLHTRPARSWALPGRTGRRAEGVPFKP